MGRGKGAHARTDSCRSVNIRVDVRTVPVCAREEGGWVRSECQTTNERMGRRRKEEGFSLLKKVIGRDAAPLTDFQLSQHQILVSITRLLFPFLYGSVGRLWPCTSATVRATSGPMD